MYSNALIITTGIVSERALYVATIPLAFLVGVAFQKNDKKWFLYLMFSYIAFFSIRTFVRNFDWKSNDTLMSNDLKHLNNSAVANFIYAKYLDSKYDFKTKFQERKENANLIINYYEKAIEVYPAYGLAYFRIADIKKYTLHDLKGSIKYYENAYNNDTANLDILFEVAKTNMELQQYDNAIINFKKLNFKNKSDTIALFYLAQCLDLSGNSSEALLVNQNLLKLAPNTEYPYLNMGTLQFKLGNIIQAVEFFEQAIAKGNRDNKLLRQLSTYFATKGDNHKSEYYQKLIK